MSHAQRIAAQRLERHQRNPYMDGTFQTGSPEMYRAKQSGGLSPEQQLAMQAQREQLGFGITGSGHNPWATSSSAYQKEVG